MSDNKYANKIVAEELKKAVKECVRGFQVPCDIVWGIDEKDNKTYKNGLTTAKNLRIQTFGIKEVPGVRAKLPARDSMYDPVVVNADVIGEIFKKSFRHTKDDQWKLLKSCKMTARWIAENVCKATILGNGFGRWHPLSEKTIARKKLNKHAMLRETEMMFDCIKGYAVCKTLGKKI